MYRVLSRSLDDIIEFYREVLLKISIDLPIGFPINNIISREALSV